MSSATMAILGHYAEDPMHNSRPLGKENWFSYDWDRATDQNTHKPIQNPLPKAVVELVKPLFERLGTVQFLSCVAIVAPKMLTNLFTIYMAVCS